MENRKMIEELIDGVILQMEEKNYAKGTIDAYRPYRNALLDFVRENGLFTCSLSATCL